MLSTTGKSQEPYEVELIDSSEALNGIRAEWERFINEGATGSNFGNDPCHIGFHLALNRACSPLMIILRRRGRICCIAPFCRSVNRFRLQLSVIKIASLPAMQLSLYGDQFLFGPKEDKGACIDAVFSALRRQRPDFGYIYISRLLSGSALWDYFASNRRAERDIRLYLATPQFEKLHLVKIGRTHDQYMSTLRPKTRQNLRRTTRRLCEQHHVALERITAPEQVPHFLEQLDRVFQNSWQAKTFGYFPRNTAAHLCYLRKIAECGWLRSYLLGNDEGPIAYDLAFQYSGVFYAQEIGYSQQWSDFGPGSVLMHLFIEDLHRHQSPRHLDFGVGDAEYKRSFSNFAHTAASVFLVPHDRWRAILQLQHALNAVERTVRGALAATHLERAVRKLLKRQR